MNKLSLSCGALVLSTLLSYSQGTFIAYNGGPPTRVGTADGPLANWDYYGQFLVGATPDALLPIYVPMAHYDGHAGGVVVTVPGVPCRQFAYVQMVAWNVRYWGQALENVPLDQLGRTDIVRRWLAGCAGDVAGAPQFTQPAIVPPIPEPSASMFGLLAGALIFAGHLLRGRPRGG